jgi:hypothetical protein
MYFREHPFCNWEYKMHFREHPFCSWEYKMHFREHPFCSWEYKMDIREHLLCSWEWESALGNGPLVVGNERILAGMSLCALLWAAFMDSLTFSSEKTERCRGPFPFLCRDWECAKYRRQAQLIAAGRSLTLAQAPHHLGFESRLAGKLKFGRYHYET